MQEPTEAPSNASLLARAAAFLIDAAVVLLISEFVAAGVTNNDADRAVILLVIASLYEIGLHLAIGATAGKMALRMHIAGANGERPEPDKVILRYLVFAASVVSIVGAVISAVMALMDPQGRALHDRIAGTRALYGRPGWLQDET
jgi:uncharacterized RDD family membrane protein YckC